MSGIDLSGLPSGLRKQFEAMAAPENGADTATPPVPVFEESALPANDAPAQEPVKIADPSTDAQAMTPTAQMLAEEGSWKVKHDAMYGRLSMQIGELKQHLASYTQQAEAMRQENAQLRAQLQAVASNHQTASPASPAASGAAMSDDYIRSVVPANVLEDYGMDYWRANLTALRTIAPAAPAAGTPAADTRLQNIEAELRRQKQDEFRRALTGMVPDWQTVNASQAWIQFLGVADRVTGYLNEELLRDAYASLDAERVAALFERFKQVHGAPAPSRSIDDLVSLPSRGGGGVPTTTTHKMTHAQWEAEMSKIASTGMTPVAAEQRMQELRDMYMQGLVTNPTGGAPPSGAW